MDCRVDPRNRFFAVARPAMTKAAVVMLRAVNTSPEHMAAQDRVREWTRERFRLGHDTTILVSQVSCRLPGCPPLETVVAFWTDDARRHQFKLFKPIAEVAPDDLPPGWMKDALVPLDGMECDCC
jgi:nitrate reductase delta subunit